MKAYLLTLTGAILLSAVASIVLPGGKMGKFLKGMTRLFVFSVVIVPLVSLFGEKKLDFKAGSVRTDTKYLETCAALLERADEREAELYLKEEYGVTSKAKMTRKAEEDFCREKIEVKIYSDGIFEPGAHIDMMRKIESVLEKNFGCKAEAEWAEEPFEENFSGEAFQGDP